MHRYPRWWRWWWWQGQRCRAVARLRRVAAVQCAGAPLFPSAKQAAASTFAQLRGPSPRAWEARAAVAAAGCSKPQRQRTRFSRSLCALELLATHHHQLSQSLGCSRVAAGRARVIVRLEAHGQAHRSDSAEPHAGDAAAQRRQRLWLGRRCSHAAPAQPAASRSPAAVEERGSE